MARRANTLDPLLAELRAEVAQRLRGAPQLPSRDAERRRLPRMRSDHVARVRIGDLSVRGKIADVGSGGVFVRTDLLVEVGEKGTLELLDESSKVLCEPVPVRVTWIRSSMHPLGVGLGLSFDTKDLDNERRAIELVLAALTSSPT